MKKKLNQTILCSISQIAVLFPYHQRYLLQQPGIHVDAMDSRGCTPLDAARSNNKTEAITELEFFLSVTK